MIPKLEKVISKLARLSKSSSQEDVDEIFKIMNDISQGAPPYIKTSLIRSFQEAKLLNASAADLDPNIEKLRLHTDSSKRALIVNLTKLCYEMKTRGIYFNSEEVSKRLHISPKDRQKFSEEYDKMILKAKHIQHKLKDKFQRFGSGKTSAGEEAPGILSATGTLIFLIMGWLFSVVVHILRTGGHYLILFTVVLWIINSLLQWIIEWRIWLARKIDPRSKRDVIPKIMEMLDIPRML